MSESEEARRARELAEAIQLLAEGFIARLPATLASMREQLDLIWQDPSNQTAWRNMHRHLHGIAGSGGTFGYTELGDRARALEIRINELPKNSAATDQSALLHDQYAYLDWVQAQYVDK
jgi:chemotaxis protein histidine kinase CheA